MPVLFFFIIVIVGVVAFFVKRQKESSDLDYSDSAPKSQSPQDGIDSWNIPSYISFEEREKIKKIAEYFGVRYVTGVETHKWILHCLSADFAAMPGWDIWDSSIHEASGQFERAQRAAADKEITILCYDSKYRLAKVQGKTAVYLTSYKRCSCPDYRKRRLPCKHMYALAMELDGDTAKDILDTEHAPLYGLTLALAGHLPKSSNGTGGIRAEITDRRGIWSEKIELDTWAAVMGSNPSMARQSRAEGFDMEILSPESILDLFAAKEVGGGNDVSTKKAGV